MPPLLQVTNLETHYVSFGGARVVKAVDDVSFTLNEGETLGIVGESGCGKTTTCLSIVGLLPPAAKIVGGHIEFAGKEPWQPRRALHVHGPTRLPVRFQAAARTAASARRSRLLMAAPLSE